MQMLEYVYKQFGLLNLGNGVLGVLATVLSLLLRSVRSGLYTRTCCVDPFMQKEGGSVVDLASRSALPHSQLEATVGARSTAKMSACSHGESGAASTGGWPPCNQEQGCGSRNDSSVEQREFAEAQAAYMVAVAADEVSLQPGRCRPSSSKGRQAAVRASDQAQRQRLVKLQQEISEDDEGPQEAPMAGTEEADNQASMVHQGWKNLERRLEAVQEGLLDETSPKQVGVPPGGRRRFFVDVVEGVKDPDGQAKTAAQGDRKYPRLQQATDTRHEGTPMDLPGVGWVCKGHNGCGFRLNNHQCQFCQICHRRWRRPPCKPRKVGLGERGSPPSSRPSSDSSSSGGEKPSPVEDEAPHQHRGKGFGAHSIARAQADGLSVVVGAVSKGSGLSQKPNQEDAALGRIMGEQAGPGQVELLRNAVTSSARALGRTHQITEILQNALRDALTVRAAEEQLMSAKGHSEQLRLRHRAILEEMDLIGASIWRQQQRREELIRQENLVRTQWTEVEATISALQEVCAEHEAHGHQGSTGASSGSGGMAEMT